MNLTVNERLNLLSILPREGNFLTIKQVRKLRESLTFNDQEHIELQFKSAGEEYEDEETKEKKIVPEGQIHWSAKADVPREVEIGEIGMELIKNTLKKLDETKKLKEEHYSLCEKFIEGVE